MTIPEGMKTVLQSGVSGKYPLSYAETADGRLMMANGIDPVVIWDGLNPTAQPAGLHAPSTAMTLGGTVLGYITGDIVAFQRYVDARGNVSDLSPVSNLCSMGYDRLIEDVSYDGTTGIVMIYCPDHGLSSGESVIIDGALGITLINGTRTITKVDDDYFILQNLAITSGVYQGGAYFTLGIKNVVYGSVARPTDYTVVRRQILRNLSGNLDAVYVDIDTDDLVSSEFTSTTLDEDLASKEAVALTYGDDQPMPFANRHAPPPSHKAVLCSHKGRIFAAADSIYDEGHAVFEFGSLLVQGYATNWKASFAGRLIYPQGSTVSYAIVSVDEDTQQMVLHAPYQDDILPYQKYVIRPEPGERRLVYYSEPGLPDSWPPYNAIAMPEANDEIVSLCSMGQYLYVIERRRISRFTYDTDPATGMVFLVAQRGSISHRTWTIADGTMYMMDEIGIHRFDGEKSETISEPVQNVFQDDGWNDIEIDWTADRTYWHAAHDPRRDTIRWFITVIGRSTPDHALCYNYKSDRWWIEAYPNPITSSTVATVDARRSLCGTNARRVVVLGQGNYDGVKEEGQTLRGWVTSATNTTLSDADATYDSMEGVPVTITAGKGAGQTRIIASVPTTTRLEIVQPWDTIPDTTSRYQIGGIPWAWKSGWFNFIQGEEEMNRDITFIFKPVSIAGRMNVQLFFDHSLTPRVWQRSIDQDGVELTKGSANIVIDMDSTRGWARQRLTAHGSDQSYGDSLLAFQLGGVQGGESIRVSSVTINGVEE